MRKRTRNALVVFLFMAVAFAIIFHFDYTDTYVSDRFHKALETGQYIKGNPFSLDAFLEYYDWDLVCVALPGSEHDFRNRLGLPYSHAATDDSVWSLVFIKKDYVIAEIAIRRSTLEYPEEIDPPCHARWSSIISIDENEGPGAPMRMSFTAI